MTPRSEQNVINGGLQVNYGTWGTHPDIKYQREYSVEYSNGNKRNRRKGLRKLFQFATNGDVLLMVIGACCAMIQGSCYPILSIIFGQMTNSLIQQAIQGIPATSHAYNGSSFLVAKISNIANASVSSEEFTNSMILYSQSYLLIGIVALFSAFLQTFCWEWVAERQVYTLRRIFFTQILRQDISWFDQNQNGDLSLKLSDDLERVRDGLGCKFSLVIQYMSTFVSGLLVGFAINWRLTSVIILLGPFLVAISAYLAKVSSSSAAREQQKYALAGSVAEEVIANIRTVAAFCKEFVEMKRYKKALDEGRKLAMHNYLILSTGLGVVYFLMYASYGFAFYFGAVLVHDGLCSPGSIFTVFLSVLAGAFSVGNALPFINCVSTAFGATSTIFEVIDREPEIDPYSKIGLKPCSVNGYIELKNVSFSYPARRGLQVLHDISVKIEKGQMVAFVGSSGAGKSTIIGLLLRFYDPSKGLITLDDMPLQQLNLNWLRHQIGFVSQEPILFSGSIADNIRYGHASVTQEEIEEAAQIANAHYFISKLPTGYNTLVGDRGSQLSGGQKQRIAIARALVRNPKILLLDEATSALDTYSEGVVQEALEKAMRGRTTIVIAHRLSTVRNADKIYVMKNGIIAESGKHEELMLRKNLYYNLTVAQTLHKTVDEAINSDWENSGDSQRSRHSSMTSSYTDEHYGMAPEFLEENLPDVSVWQLIKLNSKEWLQLTVGILMCAVTGIIMPLFSVFYTQMFVVFTLPPDQLMRNANFWSLMFVFLAVVSAITMFTQTLAMTSASEKLIMRMRSKAFNNILRQPIGWFDLETSSSGYLITRLARDAPLIKAASGLRVGHVVTAVVTMVSGLSIALYFGWKLGIVLLCGVPFIAVAAYQQNKILRKNQMRDCHLMEVAGRIASECIQNIRTVQALGSEKLFVSQYMDSLSLPFREAGRQAISFAVVFSISQTVIYVIYAVAFRYGSHLIKTKEMEPKDVYNVFFALSFCAACVGNTFSYLQDFSKAKFAARRLLQLINRKSEIDPTEPYGDKPEIRGRIRFNNVHFTYPSRTDVNVLRDFNFDLEPGATLALVGESGSGKSTIVSILERFYNLTCGSIEIDDHDITKMNVHHLRRYIGIVSQEPNLFDRSIKDNIAYGLNEFEEEAVIFNKVIKAAKSVNIHEFIISLPLGYETLIGEKGTQLSGGQKQRIAIARALVKNPKILLLDEATSALDAHSEKVVQDALDRARNGRTCITIAHRLSTIQNADIIAVMRKGKIVESGTNKELVGRRGYYYKLTERQQI